MDPYFIRELGATARGRAPFATPRYVLFLFFLAHSLTQYFRLITPKKPSATHPNSLSLNPRVVNSRKAAKTSNTKFLRPHLLHRLRRLNRRWLSSSRRRRVEGLVVHHCRYEHVSEGAVFLCFLGQTQRKRVYDCRIDDTLPRC